MASPDLPAKVMWLKGIILPVILVKFAVNGPNGHGNGDEPRSNRRTNIYI